MASSSFGGRIPRRLCHAPTVALHQSCGSSTRTSRLACDDVAAATLVFDVRCVRLTLEHFLDLEPRGDEPLLHLARREEEETERDPLLPPFLEVHGLVADVESEKQRRSRFERSRELLERARYLGMRNVDDRIERDDAGPGTVAYRQRSHVATRERDAGMQAPCVLDHARREIEAADAHAALMEITADVSGAAAEVGDCATAPDAAGKAVQDRSIERLVIELVKDAANVLVRDRIVAPAYILSVHADHDIAAVPPDDEVHLPGRTLASHEQRDEGSTSPWVSCGRQTAVTASAGCREDRYGVVACR